MQTTEPMSVDQAVESLLSVDEPRSEEVEAETVDDDDQAVEAEAEADEPEAEGEEEATEEDEAEEEADALEQPERYRVKVDGEEREVTLEELKRAYSGNAYIQKGMEQAAQARKAVEAEAASLREQQEAFMHLVQQVQTQGFAAPPQEPDATLIDSDPIGYIQARAKYDAEMKAFNAQQAEIARMSQARQALTQKEIAAERERQLQKVIEAIPDFADPEKGKAIREGLIKTGRDYGFSAEELGGVMDARTIQVLHDAMKYRELKATKAKAAPPPAPKSVKPKASTAPANLLQKKQLERVKKTGSLRDAADFLLMPKG